MEHDWKDKMNNNFKCTEVEIVAGKRFECPWTRWSHLVSWVAQNSMGTSSLQSLQKSTPNSYMGWPHLHLQKTLARSTQVRGLYAKLHHKHFEKGSDAQIIITMQFLVQKYPNSIYGMGIFGIWANLRKTGIYRGHFVKLAKLKLIKGPNTKIHPTMLISRSSYPKRI